MRARPVDRRGRCLLFLFLFLFLFFLVPAAVEAADPEFKLLIPVVVKNLHPQVESIEVVCTPKDANGAAVNFDIAHSPTDNPKPDANGGFSGTLSTSMRMFNPSDTIKVKGYSCLLRVVALGYRRAPEDCADPMANWWCLKPGTPRTLHVEGPIP